MTTTLTTPVEIDTAIAAQYYEVESKRREVANAQARQKLWEKRVGDTYYRDQNFVQRTIEQQKNQVEVYSAQLAIESEKLQELNRLYTGWTRAFLTINSNGHIHKSRDCGTCYPSTQYYWLTQVSGMTEDEIVALAGEKACTVCYPDAPSEYFMRKTQLEHPDVIAKREEREQKRIEKEEKARLVGIWNEDGEPIRVYEYGWARTKSEISNERTARSIAVGLLTNLLVETSMPNIEPNYQQKVTESIEVIVQAISRKHGTDPVEIHEELSRKAEARYNKMQKNARSY